PMVWHAFDVGLAVAMITLATGVMLYFQQEESKAEASLKLGVLARQGERIAELQTRYEELLRQREQLPDEVPDAELEALEAARRRMLEELAKLREEQTRLRAALEAAEQQEGLADQQRQRLRDTLRHLQQRIEELEARIEELEAQLEKLRYDREQIEKLEQELDDLQRKLEAARARMKDLDDKILAARRRAVEEGFRVEVHPRFEPAAFLKPEFVVIHKSTVTPVREPYYERQVRPEATIHQLRRRGPTAREALRPNSEFIRWVEKLDSQSQYVFLLVDPASFEAFRAVRAHLQERGIRYGWDPAEDVQNLGFGSGLEGSGDGQAIEVGTQSGRGG
ncbi:MAG: hypothetical protein ACOC8H_00500, partial [bacterium]